MTASVFDPGCQRCSRLARFLDRVRADYPEYHAAPVAPFGDPRPDLLIVGLAPGMHGANASGRPFTGDYAGILLYQTLYEFGFSNRPDSLHAGDGLKLRKCRITNAVKCLPPQNKPTGEEIRTCNDYLTAELETLREGSVVLALGQIAHQAVLRALGLKRTQHPFRHAGEYTLVGERTLFSSYHCSRYNTQTRRLTPDMFAHVFSKIHEKLYSNI